jgi:hypothetical protein
VQLNRKSKKSSWMPIIFNYVYLLFQTTQLTGYQPNSNDCIPCSGSNFPLGLTRMLCNKTGSEQIQDGGLSAQMHVSRLPGKIAAIFQRLYTPFWGSSFSLGRTRILYDQTGSRKIQDGGLLKSANFSEAYDQIPTDKNRMSNGADNFNIVQYHQEYPDECCALPLHFCETRKSKFGTV